MNKSNWIVVNEDGRIIGSYGSQKCAEKQAQRALINNPKNEYLIYKLHSHFYSEITSVQKTYD